ncbi:TIR domain protein [compost metagenome]
MPIFISYSHQDKTFVDKLAIQLVARNVSVWLDRWELSVGDSLVDRVQEAVDGASALLVVLSKASTASEWCKKELSAGLLRELEEKRVVVMPVMLEDCDVPVFARGKMYADFRTDFDVGLRAIIDGVAKVTNPSMSRIKETEYHTDWSIDWFERPNAIALVLTYIQAAETQPHSILTTFHIEANKAASQRFLATKKASSIAAAEMEVVEVLRNKLNSDGHHKPILRDALQKNSEFSMDGTGTGERYKVHLASRRLGEDNGRDILVHVDGLVADTYRHMSDVLRKKPHD